MTCVVNQNCRICGSNTPPRCTAYGVYLLGKYIRHTKVSHDSRSPPIKLVVLVRKRESVVRTPFHIAQRRTAATLSSPRPMNLCGASYKQPIGQLHELQVGYMRGCTLCTHASTKNIAQISTPVKQPRNISSDPSHSPRYMHAAAAAPDRVLKDVNHSHPAPSQHPAVPEKYRGSPRIRQHEGIFKPVPRRHAWRASVS